MTRTALAAAACALAVGAAAPALAQGGGGGGGRGGFGGGGMGGFGGLFGGGGDFLAPTIDSREFEKYAQMLSLDREQKEMARQLFDGYQEQFRTRAAEMRRKMDELRDQGGGARGGFAEMRPMIEEFRASRTKMEEAFFGDFRAILTPEQETRWPAVERFHRREQSITRGLMSGERVDLTRVVEQLNLPADARGAVAPILAQYEEDLDRVLIERNKVQDGLISRMGDFRQAFEDPAAREKIENAIKEGRAASTKVRDVNRNYARQIEGALPDDRRAAFSSAFKEASYPDVYRRSGTSRQIGAALGFSDLTEEQKTSVRALQETYTRENAALADKMAAAQSEFEQNFSLERMFQRGRGGQDAGARQDGPQDPLVELRRQRRDLERSTAENLRRILTPAQIDRLPQPEERDGGFGGGPRQRRGENEGGAEPPRRPRAGGGA